MAGAKKKKPGNNFFDASFFFLYHLLFYNTASKTASFFNFTTLKIPEVVNTRYLVDHSSLNNWACLQKEVKITI